MATETLFRVNCRDSDGDFYALSIPATDAEAAKAKARDAGHSPTQWGGTIKLDVATENTPLSRVAVALAWSGILFVPLALAGLVLGIQERNATATRVGAFVLLIWAVLIGALLSQ